MKVLMVTPRVDKNDPIFGFTVSWINELAKHVDSLYLISLRENKEKLPNNVKFYPVTGSNLFTKFINFQKLYFKIIPEIDLVFTHMYNEFAILAWLPCKIFRKKLVTWYAHSAVTWKLKFTNLLVDKFVCSNKNAFRLESKKLILVGQGIDTSIFTYVKRKPRKIVQFVTAGRITPVKRLEFLIDATSKLIKSGYKIKFLLVGSAYLPKDKEYLQLLQKKIKDLKLEKNIIITGKSYTHDELFDYYKESDFYLHSCYSGLDKTALEAMATGLPIVSCNNAIKQILKDYGFLYYTGKNIDELIGILKKIIFIKPLEKEKIDYNMHKIVKENHSVPHLIDNFMKVFNNTLYLETVK